MSLDDSVDQGRRLGLSQWGRIHSYFTAFHCPANLFGKLLLFPIRIFEADWNKQSHHSCNNHPPGEDKISSRAPACCKCEGKTSDNPPAQHLTSSQPSSCLAKPGNYFRIVSFHELKKIFFGLGYVPEIFRYKLQDHSWP